MHRKNYYITSDGILERKENTIYFVNRDGRRPIPISQIYTIYAYGSLTVTSQALKLLAKNGVLIHFFNKYGFYVGSFYPREKLISGSMVVEQAKHYIDKEKRLNIARRIVYGACMNISKNLARYGFKDACLEINNILRELESAKKITEIMNVEARVRELYYSHFDKILKGFEFEKRTRRPPKNEINALLSFGNSLLYGTVLSELYNTQLNPAISFLHEPYERRFSLALDLSEIFKPLIVDRLIFSLVNKGIIREVHFDKDLNKCLLNEKGKKIFLKSYNERLSTTIKHRKLRRKVSYQRLIRLEAYKLAKHILGLEEYKPFVIWW